VLPDRHGLARAVRGSGVSDNFISSLHASRNLFTTIWFPCSGSGLFQCISLLRRSLNRCVPLSMCLSVSCVTLCFNRRAFPGNSLAVGFTITGGGVWFLLFNSLSIVSWLLTYVCDILRSVRCACNSLFLLM